MSEILVALLAKVGVAIVEALAARVLWELWTAYSRTQQRAAAA